MGVLLGRRHPRVAEDFLYDADVHSLLDQQGSGRVPGVVQAPVTDSRDLEEPFPLLTSQSITTG